MKKKYNRHGFKISRLEKVLKFNPRKDEKGRYIDFCDFSWHRGYIPNPEKCIERKCKYYYKLYIR